MFDVIDLLAAIGPCWPVTACIQRHGGDIFRSAPSSCFAITRQDIGIAADCKAADQGVAALDVDVDVGQGFQLVAVCAGNRRFSAVRSRAAGGRWHDRLGVDVHAEQAVFDDGLFFVEERLLYPLRFRRLCSCTRKSGHRP